MVQNTEEGKHLWILLRIFGLRDFGVVVNPKTDSHCGYIDAAYKWGNIFAILAEFKAELGTKGTLTCK
jgi:hypothetical protein